MLYIQYVLLCLSTCMGMVYCYCRYISIYKSSERNHHQLNFTECTVPVELLYFHFNNFISIIKCKLLLHKKKTGPYKPAGCATSDGLGWRPQQNRSWGSCPFYIKFKYVYIKTIHNSRHVNSWPENYENREMWKDRITMYETVSIKMDSSLPGVFVQQKAVSCPETCQMD